MKSENIEVKIANFLTVILDDERLNRSLRLATTASAVCDVAEAAGISIKPAELVKYYARLLLDSNDEIAVLNFDNCSWDAGELCWIMKNWKMKSS